MRKEDLIKAYATIDEYLKKMNGLTFDVFVLANEVINYKGFDNPYNHTDNNKIIKDDTEIILNLFEDGSFTVNSFSKCKYNNKDEYKTCLTYIDLYNDLVESSETIFAFLDENNEPMIISGYNYCIDENSDDFYMLQDLVLGITKEEHTDYVKNNTLVNYEESSAMKM